MNQRTVDMLTEMKMAAMVAEFSHQLNDPLFNSLSFEERLSMPITTEWNRRQTNKIDRLIKKAHFSASSATVKSIEYYEDRKLDKAIYCLRAGKCRLPPF